MVCKHGPTEKKRMRAHSSCHPAQTVFKGRMGPAENLYEEVEPVAVLETRVSDAGRDFLVKFPDAEEDCWV